MSTDKHAENTQEEKLDDVDMTNNQSEDEVTEESAEKEVQEKQSEEDWQVKYDELKDSYLRLNAEFDNFRKRTLKEKADLLKTGSEKVLVDVINVVDDFERALENISTSEDTAAVAEGINLIYTKFVNFLTKHNVKAIEAVGQVFDVDVHEAITTIPAAKEEDKDKVVDCIQKGYTLGDKVIRFPKVIVAK